MNGLQVFEKKLLVAGHLWRGDKANLGSNKIKRELSVQAYLAGSHVKSRRRMLSVEKIRLKEKGEQRP